MNTQITSPALYIRISTEDQNTDSQLLELEEYCRRRGWQKNTVYKDVISGAKPTRPGLDQMIKDGRKGRIDAVVTYKLDRIGRSLTHLALILEELNCLKIPLICTSQGIDTSHDNPVGKLQLHVLMAVGRSSREPLSGRGPFQGYVLLARRASGSVARRPCRSTHQRSEI